MVAVLSRSFTRILFESRMGTLSCKASIPRRQAAKLLPFLRNKDKSENQMPESHPRRGGRVLPPARHERGRRNALIFPRSLYCKLINTTPAATNGHNLSKEK